MGSIETFRHKKMFSAETVGFRFEADLFKSVAMIVGCGSHWQHWDVSPSKNGCGRNRWLADLFKSAPMIPWFRCHGQHWDASPYESGCCGNRWFQIRSRPLQIGTDDRRFFIRIAVIGNRIAVIGNVESYRDKKMFAAEAVGFKSEAPGFCSQDNTETFHNKIMVVAEAVGFRFEADLFKSITMILGFGCHGHHRDAAP